MSKVSVHQPHALDKATAKSKLADFGELLGKYNVKLDWHGDKATIKGLGVSGDVVVSDAAVDVSLKLGLLAKAAGVDGTKLESSIAKRLKAAFAA